MLRATVGISARLVGERGEKKERRKNARLLAPGNRDFCLSDTWVHLGSTFNPDVVLVIVDTITSFFGDINTNADKDVRPVMDALTEAFRDCQATFLAIVHHNKKNDADAIQKILGASSLPGSVRVAYSFS